MASMNKDLRQGDGIVANEVPLRREAQFDVTLAGETNLDLILYGLPEQMPVDRELLASKFEFTLGGSSSILAHNLSKLGSKVGFSTQVGRDEMGSLAVERLREARLDLSHVTVREEKTTGITLVLPHGAHRHILTHLGVMAEMTVGDLDLAYISSSSHFHLSSLFLQTALQAGMPALFSTLKQAGLTLSLDTNDDPHDKWGGVLDELIDRVDVLLPNEEEVQQITQQPTLEQALQALEDRVPVVVVKCGPRGAIVQQGRTRTLVEAPRVHPVDTIGAGDSFNAGFLHVFARGGSAVAAASFGTVTGALSTLRAGGTEAFRDAELMAHFLAEHAGGGGPWMSAPKA